MCACACVCVEVWVGVCVYLAFISRGWLFAWGQVLFTVLLPCSVSVCGGSQEDWKCSYTQGRTVDTHRNKERERSCSPTHHLSLFIFFFSHFTFCYSGALLLSIASRMISKSLGYKCSIRHKRQLRLLQFKRGYWYHGNHASSNHQCVVFFCKYISIKNQYNHNVWYTD